MGEKRTHPSARTEEDYSIIVGELETESDIISILQQATHVSTNYPSP